MKFIKCRKCGRYFTITDNDYCLSKCTGCGSTDLEETIYKIDGSDIDWEQRRYEIAKNILATSHIAQQIGKYGYHYEEEVNEAVRMANMLIAELKKTNETSLLKLSVRDCSMDIEGNDVEFCKSAKETIKIEKTGDDITIGVKADILSIALSTVKSESFSLLLSKPERPILISEKDDKKVILVMPMMLK